MYQAYSPEIAEPALEHGTFVPPFSEARMTWIKPSFLWMMYRSGWATKRGQERVLAVTITRAGLDWALAHSALSHHDPDVYTSHEEWQHRLAVSPVRVQWDPERSLTLEPLKHRAIQVGLGPEAVQHYLKEWIVAIADVTPMASHIHALVAAGDREGATAALPVEEPLPLSAQARSAIGADG